MKTLTKVVLKNSKRTDEYKSKKDAVLAFLAFFIVFSFLSGMMIFFSVTVTKQLVEIKQEYAFVNILLLINFFILFTKSVFESLNVLYFSKDLRIFLRMPIKSIDILNSKFLNMIISEYQMELIMLAIPMVVYGIIVNANILFYLYMLIILVFIPIIPIMLTSLIIAIIMRFTNFIKNKSKVMYITIIVSLLFLGIIMGLFNNTQTPLTVSSFKNIILRANGLAENIANYFILIKPIMNTLLNYNNINGIKNLILYIIENIICYFGILFIISKIYLKGAIGSCINTSSNTKINYVNFNLKTFKKSSIIKSYLKKEFKTIFRTPIFFIQCIIMPILDPIAIFLIIIGLINFGKLVGINLWNNLYEVSIKTNGLAIYLGVGQIFYMMNFSSIIGISRERNNAIISKYIPVDYSKQFNFKILLGVIINSVGTILVTLFYYLCTQNKLFSIIILLELFFINLICEKIKLLIDLNKPQLNWDSEYTMMKQNTNVMYELFYTLLVCLILFVISNIFTYDVIFLTSSGICLLIINLVINKYVEKEKNKIFSKIY